MKCGEVVCCDANMHWVPSRCNPPASPCSPFSPISPFSPFGPGICSREENKTQDNKLFILSPDLFQPEQNVLSVPARKARFSACFLAGTKEHFIVNVQQPGEKPSLHSSSLQITSPPVSFHLHLLAAFSLMSEEHPLATTAPLRREAQVAPSRQVLLSDPLVPGFQGLLVHLTFHPSLGGPGGQAVLWTHTQRHKQKRC